MTNRRKDGSLYAEEMTITPLRDADGVIARYIAIKQDISDASRRRRCCARARDNFVPCSIWPRWASPKPTRAPDSGCA